MLTASKLLPELQFLTSRSSGPGGQNVNKVNSKVTLRFDIKQSALLSESERETLLIKLASKLTTDGELLISVQEHRSQLANKEAAMLKLDQLLKKAFTKPKVRKKTKPTKSSKEKRFSEKKLQGEKKKWRQKL